MPGNDANSDPFEEREKHGVRQDIDSSGVLGHRKQSSMLKKHSWCGADHTKKDGGFYRGTGADLPAVKGDLVAAQVEVGVGEEAGSFAQERPQQRVCLVAHRIHGALLTRRLLLAVVAVCQQAWIALAPGRRVPCAI